MFAENLFDRLPGQTLTAAVPDLPFHTPEGQKMMFLKFFKNWFVIFCTQVFFCLFDPLDHWLDFVWSFLIDWLDESNCE